MNTSNVSSGGVIINEDTDVSIEVAYYENALCRVTGTTINPLPFGENKIDGSDGKQNAAYEATFAHLTPANVLPCGFYLCRDKDDDTLFTQTITFNIKAGSYEPQALASLITNGIGGVLDKTVSRDVGSTDTGIMIDIAPHPIEDDVNVPEGNQKMVLVPGKKHVFPSGTGASVSSTNTQYFNKHFVYSAQDHPYKEHRSRLPSNHLMLDC